jgi:hypothetical protein
MRPTRTSVVTIMFVAIVLSAGMVSAQGTTDFSFSTGDPDGRMAVATRPESHKKIEVEAADDFIFTSTRTITEATFTGMLFNGGRGEIREVAVEIYRVFPLDSNTVRPIHVPTRQNSPSDNAFAARSSADGTLRFSVDRLSARFQADNSVIDGINPSPNQHTLGEGPVVGQEVQFDVVFDPPIVLPADHYFFVPQVRLQGVGGNFLWLSAPRPTSPPIFVGDLQMWIRNADLDPDWLRVGADIVGGSPAPTFNGSFSLRGTP